MLLFLKGSKHRPVQIAVTDLKKNESKHPTLMIRRATLTLLRVISVATGVYSETAQKEAVNTLCGLMRNVVDCGCNYGLSKLFARKNRECNFVN